MKILAIYLIICCAIVMFNIIVKSLIREEEYMDWIQQVKELNDTNLTKVAIFMGAILIAIVISVPYNIFEIVTILKGDSDS